MATYILKRKTFSEEKQGMSTGMKVALGTAAAAAATFAGARRGMLGVNAAKTTNTWFAKAGQAMGGKVGNSMIESGATKFGKVAGDQAGYDLLNKFKLAPSK